MLSNLAEFSARRGRTKLQASIRSSNPTELRGDQRLGSTPGHTCPNTPTPHVLSPFPPYLEPEPGRVGGRPQRERHLEERAHPGGENKGGGWTETQLCPWP